MAKRMKHSLTGKKKTKETLLTEDNFLIVTGLSRRALRQCEKNGFVKPENRSDGTNYYSKESADLLKSMKLCLGRCANLAEAYEIALEGMLEQQRRHEQITRMSEGQDDRHGAVDPKKIKKHPRLETLLPIAEDLLASISLDMAVNGYDPLKPVLMGIWAELEEPVLIDGHTRVRAAIAAGWPLVPYAVREFEDELAAVLHTTKLQTQRRQTDRGVQFRLFESVDALIQRGGDRRSEDAKSKPPNGGIEKKRFVSAQRTADLVGWSVRMVERARRIRDQGSPAILKAIRNSEMSIGQAEKAIAPKVEPETAEESLVSENKNRMVSLTDENLAGLEKLGGNRHSHVNAAVKAYIAKKLKKRQHRKKAIQKPRSQNHR